MTQISPLRRLCGRVRDSVRWRLGARPLFQLPLPAALAAFRNGREANPPPARPLDRGLALIVPVYGHEAHLEACFKSIGRQTLRPFEAIFVEDHSPDRSLQRLRRLIPELPAGIRGRLLRTRFNSGQCAAINLAVRKSNASLYVVLNDDDYLMHDALEAAAMTFERLPQIYLFGASCVRFTGEGEPPEPEALRTIRARSGDLRRLPVREFQPSEVRGFTHRDDLNMTHSSSCFHRAAWECAGGYFSNQWKRVVTFSDRDFQLRVASLLPCATANTVPFAYWREGSSVDAGRQS